MVPRGRITTIMVGAILAGVLAGIAMCFFQALYQAKHFPPRVYIGGAEVGGEDRETAYRTVESWVGSVGDIPVIFTYGSFEHRTDLKEIGARVDITRAVDDALASIRGNSPWWKYLMVGPADRISPVQYELPLSYDMRRLSGILQSLRGRLETPPRNCEVKVSGEKVLVVTPEVNGKTVDIQATLKGLPEYLQGREVVVPIVVKEVQPQLRREHFSDMVQLASFSTRYNAGNVDRSFNLSMAARALNGTIVPEGEEFSFNGVVGPRELNTGYREAMVILGNEFTPGVGGGVCQVVSTLYNACLLSGLKIVERHNHSVAINYVPTGLDATVNYGSKDFRFKNLSGGPIYLQAYARAGRLTVRVFGPAGFKKDIRLERVVVGTTPFKVVERPDSTLPPGTTKVKQEGVPGYVVLSYRITCDDNGQVTGREFLARDVYKPLNKVILTGPPLSTEVAGPPGETPGDLPPAEEPPQLPPLSAGGRDDPGVVQ